MRKRLAPSRFILLSCILMIGCVGAAARNQPDEDAATGAAGFLTATIQNETQPLIRVANLSSIDLDSVVVNFPDQVEGYGPVPK